MWSSAACPHRLTSQGAFQRYDSRQIGGQNMARVRLPQFDALYEQAADPARRARADRRLSARRERVALAYMPYKNVLNRLSLDMAHQRVIGYRRPVFWQEWWHTSTSTTVAAPAPRRRPEPMSATLAQPQG